MKSNEKKMPDRNIIGIWTTCTTPVACSSVLRNEASRKPIARKAPAPRRISPAIARTLPTIWTLNTAMPIPMISTASTAATISRSRMLLATSFQRASGVAPIRFRIPFSRCCTSGIAAKTPELHQGHRQDAGHEIGDVAQVRRRERQLLDRDDRPSRRPAAG